MIHVLLADDQPIIVSSLTTILELGGDISVVATAATGREAVEAARAWKLDVAILDIDMPDLDGLSAAEQICQIQPQTAVLMLTTFDDERYISRALDIGVQGFLLKDDGPDFLIDAVRRAATGASILSPGVTGFVLQAARAQHRTVHTNITLTARESDILRLVAKARTNAEIAEELHISLPTVKTYISRLITKIEVRDRVGLAVWAHEAGIHPQGDSSSRGFILEDESVIRI